MTATEKNMGFINISEFQPIEPVPGCRMRTPFGKNLMLSYLEMDDGAEVPEARGIYSLAAGPDGSLWAGGAGKNVKKYLWRHDGKTWNPGIELEKCIALYSIAPVSATEVWLGGWNADRRGSVWIFKDGKATPPTDLQNSFVIRDLAPISK